jgi:quinol monooxygenase YgiN
VYRDRDAFEAHRARARTSEWGTAGAHLPRQITVEEIG